MSRIHDFYRGVGPDSRGRKLADLWEFSDSQMEGIHDFIQWLFPLREPSRFNPDAPLLTDADVAAFHADPHLRENLLRSFETFLAFLGLCYADGQVTKTSDFERKRAVFEHPNHNWLRITRVLASTRILGLAAPSRAFLAFLEGLRDSGAVNFPTETFRYWENAATGPGED